MSTTTPWKRLAGVALVAAFVTPASAGNGNVRLIAQPGDRAERLEPDEVVIPTADAVDLSIDRTGRVLFDGSIRTTNDVFVVGGQGNIHLASAPGEPDGIFDQIRQQPFDETNVGLDVGRRVFETRREPNAFGLYDMHGNVGEWCEDISSKSFYSMCKEEGTVTDPRQLSGSGDRILRGGSWYDQASVCRSGRRSRGRPGLRGARLGFRPARPLQ